MKGLVMVVGNRHKRNGRRAGSNSFDRLESAYRQDLLGTLSRREGPARGYSAPPLAHFMSYIGGVSYATEACGRRGALGHVSLYTCTRTRRVLSAKQNSLAIHTRSFISITGYTRHNGHPPLHRYGTSGFLSRPVPLSTPFYSFEWSG